MVATHLMATLDTRPDVLPVVLVGDDQASGLADMLRQFIEQTLAESPRKQRQARSLSGATLFRSAEDDDLCVCITFAGDHIELRDEATPPVGLPAITADFLTIAHLTSGQANPFWLLARRRLQARFTIRQVPFLLRLLRFMRIERHAPSNQMETPPLPAGPNLPEPGEEAPRTR